MPEEHSRLGVGVGGGGLVARGTLSWSGGGGGSGVRDMASPSLENLGAKFSKTSFPHFTTSLHKLTVV